MITIILLTTTTSDRRREGNKEERVLGFSLKDHRIFFFVDEDKEKRAQDEKTQVQKKTHIIIISIDRSINRPSSTSVVYCIF